MEYPKRNIRRREGVERRVSKLSRTMDQMEASRGVAGFISNGLAAQYQPPAHSLKGWLSGRSTAHPPHRTPSVGATLRPNKIYHIRERHPTIRFIRCTCDPVCDAVAGPFRRQAVSTPSFARSAPAHDAVFSRGAWQTSTCEADRSRGNASYFKPCQAIESVHRKIIISNRATTHPKLSRSGCSLIRILSHLICAYRIRSYQPNQESPPLNSL